jgi:hypothetical protein
LYPAVARFLPPLFPCVAGPGQGDGVVTAVAVFAGIYGEVTLCLPPPPPEPPVSALSSLTTPPRPPPLEVIGPNELSDPLTPTAETIPPTPPAPIITEKGDGKEPGFTGNATDVV